MSILKQITEKVASRKLGATVGGALAVTAVPESLTWQTVTIISVYIITQGLIDLFKE